MEILKEKSKIQYSYEEKIATRMILQMGIQANLKGYSYLRKAIALAAQNPELQCNQLYGIIAEIYGVKPKSVERAIRYAIDLAYDVNQRRLQNFFPYPVTKPGNWEVIALAADRVRVQL